MSLNTQQINLIEGFISSYATFRIMECGDIKYLFLTNLRNIPEGDKDTTVGIFINLTEFNNPITAVNWLVDTHMNTLYYQLMDSTAEKNDQYRFVVESRSLHDPYREALIAQGIKEVTAQLTTKGAK